MSRPVLSMSRFAWPLLAAAIVCFASATAQAQGAAPPCPVTGQPASPDISLAHRGGKVFFATEEAKTTYEAEPAKYTLAANYQLVATNQAVQVACPILGKQLPAVRQFQVHGVAVCCPGCQGKLAGANQQQFAETCFGANFDKIFQMRPPQQ